MLIKSQLEVHLHTRRSVQFHPIPFTRPFLSGFFEALVPRLHLKMMASKLIVNGTQALKSLLQVNNENRTFPWFPTITCTPPWAY